jgi:putative acetyltransferase
MTVILREERPSDADAVHAITRAAFGQPDEADLVRRLWRDGDVEISLVAEDAGRLLGHVLLSRMTAPFRALALAPVSVAPERQNAGIGSNLIRAAVARARDGGWMAIFVLGDPAYYTRFGFDVRLAEGFSSPYAGAHFMVLPLTAALPVTSGTLVHAAAFSGP